MHCFKQKADWRNLNLIKYHIIHLWGTKPNENYIKTLCFDFFKYAFPDGPSLHLLLEQHTLGLLSQSLSYHPLSQ